ncbi:MAG TPA: hypothetical protein VFQ24_00120 [Terriglobia bacterium]|nr:hypothetical protein [Terriglobia bacterium]
MAFDPRIHHRRSIRLRGYDYAGGGAYFVTICTQARKCLFGEIVEGSMILNEVGRFVQRVWHGLPQRFGSVVLDAFQMMPNHLHAIFVLPGLGLEPAIAVATGAPVIQPSGVGAGLDPPTRTVGVGLALPRARQAVPLQHTTPRRTSMGDVVGAFKSISTIALNQLGSRPGARPLQKNFYEHIIRDVGELEMIRDYIAHNPQHWLEDPENPNMP